MSYTKTPEEINKIREGGKILGKILNKLAKMVKPGASAYEIDLEAERLIVEAGGLPAFKGFRGHENEPPFPSTICACVNDELVHGIAHKDKILKDGDIFTIDIGMEYPVRSVKKQEKANRKKGYFTDTALTLIVGKVSEETKKLLDVTRKSLEIGIKQCVVGNTVADIGRAIQDYVEPFGYGIVRDLVGHGVGHAVHEDPRVPNYYDKAGEKWILKEGVVIAIEPMVNMSGNYKVKVADDGWSISTTDGGLCAHFEHTIIITKKGPIVATRRPGE